MLPQVNHNSRLLTSKISLVPVSVDIIHVYWTLYYTYFNIHGMTIVFIRTKVKKRASYSYLRYLWGRLAYVELLSKWYLWNPHNSEITLRLLDNNNCYNLYRDETSNVHVTEEIFTLLTINNYNVVETGGVIDFTLILGNHVDSYLYGLLSVTNGWYRGSLTKLVLFWIYLVYSFVLYHQ